MECNKLLKKIGISVLPMSSISSIISIVIIWFFLNRMGRLDIFNESVSFKNMFNILVFSFIINMASFLIIFFMGSWLLSLFIPAENKHFIYYDNIKNNLITILMVSGFFTPIIIALSVFIFDDPSSVFHIIILSSFFILVVSISIVSYLMNKKILNQELRIKSNTIKNKYKFRIYLLIPFFISVLSYSQIIPISLFSDSMKFPDLMGDTYQVIGFVAISYAFYIFTIFPGVVFIRMNNGEKLVKKVTVPIALAFAIMLVMSYFITVIPVMFVHSVMKLSGISDFTPHTYLVDEKEYPQNLFDKGVWISWKVEDTGKIAIRAVSIFSFGEFQLMCPSEITKAYKESWKFIPGNTDYDNKVRKALQEDAEWCIAFNKEDIKRWNVPISYQEINSATDR
ncbi:hypothetical protein [Xenorhabdus siamensis]|uniref:hypothetical protein n=1 Tax=Xenorhabdus siamensis TaxID=3136254 RepID=UPI0030F44B47